MAGTAGTNGNPLALAGADRASQATTALMGKRLPSQIGRLLAAAASAHCCTSETADAPSECPAIPRWPASRRSHTGLVQSICSSLAAASAWAFVTSDDDQPGGAYVAFGVDKKNSRASIVPRSKLAFCWDGTPLVVGVGSPGAWPVPSLSPWPCTSHVKTSKPRAARALAAHQYMCS